ncbi:MAG: hypothetical protein GX860_05215 [Alcaligenaceae bacterium]|nr:hypothetical protein [Alcaligenaceae bacterium]
MKVIAMYQTQIQRILLTTALSFGLAVAGYSLAHAEVRQDTNDQQISYQTGGVGQEELAELRQNASNYNTQFSFANAADKAYLNNLQIRIINDQDALVFEDNTVGPMLYLQLEPGTYELSASSDNIEKKLKFTVKKDAKVEEVITW